MGDGATVVFLHGADMAPELIRAVWPSARFVARARAHAGDLATSIPAGTDAQEIWGILLTAPEVDEPGQRMTATTDDGRSIDAIPLTTPNALADPAATLAAARYWELPPAYVSALAELVPVP